jgi:hypothetical protein
VPMYENLPVKVTLTVEVDGHVLTFDGSGEVRGARYHGADPRENGYATSETLESGIRGAVDTGAARAVKAANEMVARMYPVAESREAMAR